MLVFISSVYIYSNDEYMVIHYRNGEVSTINVNYLDTIYFSNDSINFWDLLAEKVDIIDSITFAYDTITDVKNRFEYVNFTPTQRYYVSMSGNDNTGDGSYNNPWKNLHQALFNIRDKDGDEGGFLLTILDDDYVLESSYLTIKFKNKIMISPEKTYARIRAKEDAHRVFFFDGAENYIVAGFEIVGNPAVDNYSEQYSHLIQISGSHHITFENCIIHDSYNNDNIKINNYSDGVVFRGNMIYNQGQNENFGTQHYDAFGANNLVIEDNIFFNGFTSSGRPSDNNATASFVMIKSNGNPPSKNVTVARNVFFSWWGKADQSMLLFGEDGSPNFEVENAIVENNLFIGNTENRMSGFITLKGAKGITIRANTFTGFVNHSPAFGFEGNFGYGVRIQREGQNPQHENIFIYNNIWTDPTGRMLFFSGGTSSYMRPGTSKLSNNLFYNNDEPIEEKPNNCFTQKLDIKKIIADPMIEKNLKNVRIPFWQFNQKKFADGSETIEEVRLKFINEYCKFQSNESPAINKADIMRMPIRDILFKKRDANPDIGAYENGN